METDKEMFNFFNEFIFIDHSKVGVDVKINVLRKYITNRFHDTIPPNRILTTLSLIDGIILKLHDKYLEIIQDEMYDVRENVLYMLSFEKFVEEENPVENLNVINVENMNTMPENEQVRAYKEGMKTILEIARDHYEGTYPYLEKVIEDCSKY